MNEVWEREVSASRNDGAEVGPTVGLIQWGYHLQMVHNLHNSRWERPLRFVTGRTLRFSQLAAAYPRASSKIYVLLAQV